MMPSQASQGCSHPIADLHVQVKPALPGTLVSPPRHSVGTRLCEQSQPLQLHEIFDRGL